MRLRIGFSGLGRWIGEKASRLRKEFDLRDVHIYGGLALITAGGVQLSPAWTLIAVGVSLTALGVFAPRRAA